MSYKLTYISQKPDIENRIAVFEERHQDMSSAISFMEAQDDKWIMEIYFHEDLTPSHITQTVSPLFKGCTYTLEELPEMDWVSESQRFLKPVKAGRFFVYGSHDADIAPKNYLGIKIDAATAFGTGHHGTTKGCLLALDELGKSTSPETVLDVGCGSAILAIAAAKKFKTEILATDIDAEAVLVARQNIKDNNAHGFVHAVTATGFKSEDIALSAPYDLILANILAKPLCRMAQDMKAHTRQGSHLILSGILTEQGQMVEACFRNRGFILKKRVILGEWLTLILIRK